MNFGVFSMRNVWNTHNLAKITLNQGISDVFELRVSGFGSFCKFKGEVAIFYRQDPEICDQRSKKYIVDQIWCRPVMKYPIDRDLAGVYRRS